MSDVHMLLGALHAYDYNNVNWYICTCVLYNNIIEGYNFQIYCNATACEDACIRVLHTYYTIDTYIYTYICLQLLSVY